MEDLVDKVLNTKCRNINVTNVTKILSKELKVKYKQIHIEDMPFLRHVCISFIDKVVNAYMLKNRKGAKYRVCRDRQSIID